ncbi:hypothetical protein Hanom_Chr16g01471441 [Helianthus anomalus]
MDLKTHVSVAKLKNRHVSPATILQSKCIHKMHDERIFVLSVAKNETATELSMLYEVHCAISDQ